MKKEEQFNPESYTKYEKARIIGARALQLSMNAPMLLKVSKEEIEKLNYDPLKIAEMEFFSGVLPITVRRPMPQKAVKEVEGKAIEEIEAVEAEIETPEEKVEEKKEVAKAEVKSPEEEEILEFPEEEEAPETAAEVAE